MIPRHRRSDEVEPAFRLHDEEQEQPPDSETRQRICSWRRQGRAALPRAPRSVRRVGEGEHQNGDAGDAEDPAAKHEPTAEDAADDLEIISLPPLIGENAVPLKDLSTEQEDPDCHADEDRARIDRRRSSLMTHIAPVDSSRIVDQRLCATDQRVFGFSQQPQPYLLP